ncbi:GNAT family N-acetyltransferase [Streptomyces sp.]|uniref:GNAT family N-acetyltransferase n=1 Tax=Streptomyces sp. TaxID=1931 RepID=UPI002F40B3D7
MTTTLRPDGPERRTVDGARARTYSVCVNSRPVGRVELTTDPRFGPTVGRIEGLAVDEGERRRGRGTVAALAGEEVLRSWGCTRVEIAVPADATYALRLAASLGYVEGNRHLAKELDGARRALPPGSVLRPLSEAGFGPWREREREEFIAALTDRGVPRDQAEARESAALREVLPQGLATPGTALLALDHDGRTVGCLLVRTLEPAWVLAVDVETAHRGRGHGRTLMLGAENACLDAGTTTLGLNVFVANTPAVRLYESLGYRTVERYFAKTLDVFR